MPVLSRSPALRAHDKVKMDCKRWNFADDRFQARESAGARTIADGGSVLGERICRRQFPSHARDKNQYFEIRKITAW
jgi:hypothetical protein